MTQVFLGEIKMFGTNFAPRGFAFCNGGLLAINQNQALFSLLGTTFGGNGVRRPSSCRTCKAARRSTSGRVPA